MDENKSNLGILNIDTIKYKTILTAKYLARKKYVPKDPKLITAFIPGQISNIMVRKGKKVKEGQTLLILEAMKMRNLIDAPFAGTIKSINIKEGDNVTKDQVLIELK
jgi:biotin carboxyl carrier protein